MTNYIHSKHKLKGNKMSASQKQAGDLVQITGGANKEQEGVLQEKVSNGWNIKLRSGEVVLTSFPFIKLIAKQGEFEENPQTDQPQNSEPIPEDITKLNTLQLRELAKRKGVSIARTKEDFLRIIKEKKPSEDLERLKGKVLFDRVSELRISRLRSKEDLQKLLA